MIVTGYGLVMSRYSRREATPALTTLLSVQLQSEQFSPSASQTALCCYLALKKNQRKAGARRLICCVAMTKNLSYIVIVKLEHL